jgi:hypothetical protein
MIKGILVLASGTMAAFMWALVIIYFVDNIHPQIMVMSGLQEGDLLWPCVMALEAFIVLCLLIPWIIAAYYGIAFVLRILKTEREEYAV